MSKYCMNKERLIIYKIIIAPINIPDDTCTFDSSFNEKRGTKKGLTQVVGSFGINMLFACFSK
jgi:hypothetical protein